MVTNCLLLSADSSNRLHGNCTSMALVYYMKHFHYEKIKYPERQPNSLPTSQLLWELVIWLWLDCMLHNMIYVTPLSQFNQHDGCWWPGIYLVWDHLQSWWHRVTGTYYNVTWVTGTKPIYLFPYFLLWYHNLSRAKQMEMLSGILKMIPWYVTYKMML